MKITGKGKTSIFDEEEYDLSASSDQEGESAKAKSGLEIQFNRILAKIPSELHVYVQPKTFEQFNKEMGEYERWKINESDENGRYPITIKLPEVMIENQIPIDDVFQLSSNSSEW